MVNYGAAFKLPFSNWKRVGVLFVLTLVISLLSEASSVISELGKNELGSITMKLLLVELVLFLVMIFFSIIESGYGLRIVRSASQGRSELPSFEKFFSLLVQGLKYSLATLIYFIPFIIAMIIGVALVIGGAASHSAGLIVTGVVILVPILLVWLVFAAYVLPMLMAHFAHEGRFSAFFELRRTLKYAFTVSYFVPWLAAFGYSIALFIPYFIVLLPISLISIVVPVAALLIAPVSALYGTILTPTVMSLYGQAYYDVRAAERGKAAVGRLHVARKK